ncbi:MAG TPA: glycosyltransferase family 4 protein [Candidatus Nanoarchaeia archaeon]|nr:glycosyltransferase family 4 protein [Candidatus Nanoarchaeia archaeon]
MKKDLMIIATGRMRNELAVNRLNYYKKYFNNIFTFTIDKDKRPFYENNIKYFPANYFNFLVKWPYYFLNLNTKNISYIKCEDPLLGGFFGVVFSKILRVPLVMRYNTDWKNILKMGFKEHNVPYSKRLIRLLSYPIISLTYAMTIKYCTKIASISRSIAPKSPKVVVVHNGVPVNLFKPMNVNKLKKDLGLNNKKLTIGYFGRLDPLKGVSYLIEAMNDLKKDFNFIVIGNGELKNKYKRLATYARFLGRIDYGKMPYYYNLCDIIVSPSLSEGLGFTIIEAMSCGKAVIATKVGGIPEVIKSKNLGILVQPKNSKEIKEAIIRLSDAKLRKKIELNAREHVVINFDWDKQMKKLVKVLFDIN